MSGGPDAYLTDLESAFLAGLLTHLPAATLFTMPTRASYARMLDGVWAGGTYVAWGRDHKEAPIRLTGRVDSAVNDPLKGARFEIKSIDGTSCPYAAVTSLLAAGMIGIREKAKLHSHGLLEQAHELSDAQRKRYGANRRMPLNLEEAREYLNKDEKLQKALGREFVERFLAVNKVRSSRTSTELQLKRSLSQTLDGQLAASSEGEAMVKLVKMY